MAFKAIHIGFVILLCAIHLYETIAVSNVFRRFYDLTEPINDMMSGNTLISDFTSQFQKELVSNKGSVPQLETPPVTVLYNSDCSAFESCGDLKSKIQFMKDVLGKTINVDIMISLKFEAYTQTYLPDWERILPTNAADVDFLVLQFPLNESIGCSFLLSHNYNIRSFFTAWQLQTRLRIKVGLGFNLILKGCDQFPMLIEPVNFLMNHITFGATAGVPESFGIFRKTVDFYHNSNMVFLKNTTSTNMLRNQLTPEIFYIPLAKTVGSEKSRKLLQEYSKNWVEKGIENTYIVVPAPGKEPDVERGNVSLSTYVWFGDIFLGKKALLPIKRNFDSILISTDIGYADEVLTFFVLNNPCTTEDTCKVNLDFSKDVMGQRTKGAFDEIVAIDTLNKWTKDSNKSKTFKVNMLLFELLEYGKNISANVSTKFARRLSKNYTIGCIFDVPGEYIFPNIEDPVLIVNACKTIYGSVYVFRFGIKFSDPNNPFFYSNGVRYRLELNRAYRAAILKQHPDSTVYFDFEIIPSSHIQNNTIFCDSATLTINEFYDAIITWGKFNGIPLILKQTTDLQSVEPNTKGWLSSLRPTKELSNFHRYPFFVIRNYPIGINGWEVDPCIMWSQNLPDMQPNYFHSGYVGTLFHPEYYFNNKSDAGSVQELMFQYIFHRFNFTEIQVESDVRRVFETLHSLKYNQSSNAQQAFIFVSKSSKNQTANIIEILQDLEDSPQSLPNVLKGIHINLTETIVRIHLKIEDHSDHWPFKENWNSLRRKLNSLNVTIGVLLDSHACHTLYKLAQFNQTIHNVVTGNYVVCSESFVLLVHDDMKNLGHVFDYHLYIKRALNEILPHITVYFRVKVIASLKEGSSSMYHYFRLLSHIKQFGVAYDIKYFIVEAFDVGPKQQNGWWKIENYTDLENPFVYVEKEAVYSQRQLWHPSSVSNHMKTPTEIDSLNLILISIIPVFVALLIICFVVIGYFYMRRKRLTNYLTQEEIDDFLKGGSSTVKYNRNVPDSIDIAKGTEFSSEYELSILDLNIDSKKMLGFGNFGTVYKGTAKGVSAAIKCPNQDCRRATFKSFLREVKVLCYIGKHRNVVNFLGAYVKEIRNGILYIATEFCENGSLSKVLEGLKVDEEIYQDQTSERYYDLHRFCKEIAQGMDYIGTQNVVHGDLAARNVMVDEHKTCKIGDFGLSRILREYKTYTKKSGKNNLPWKWMAFESLSNSKFTLKSDVWSYGITVWEIYSLGSIPYGGLDWSPGFVDELRNGLRLTSPTFASAEIYETMKHCWKLDPEGRPAFEELADFFGSIR